jgi:hypothetical protein
VPASDQPDRVKGPQSRARLCASTAAGLALVAGVALMALPRDPGHAGSGIKLALQDPIVLIPLLAVTTLVLLASIRAWTYRRLTRLPGPILAHTLVDARATAGSADEIPITLLDTRFRQRLSELQLSAATPSPGGTPTTDFIELLETSTFDPKQPFATLGRILRLVRPTHAYEVRTTLLQRDKAPSRGVALEVVVLPQRRTTLRMYWRTNWAAALDRAATGVAAEVVPRSRHSDTGVWSTWQGLVLDDELFDLYQRSQILRGRRRYDEALDLLYRAVRADPANAHLRLALGEMQEALALHLDALLSYSSIRPEMAGGRERIDIRACYERAVLLGFGERMAEQWLPPPRNPATAPSRRSLELRVLRERIRPELIEALTDIGDADRHRLGLRHYRRLADGVEELLDEHPVRESQRAGDVDPISREMTNREKQDSRSLRERRLHLLFQLVAERQIERLLSRHSRRELARMGSEPTLTEIELLPAWARLRTTRARRLLDAELEHQRARRAGVNASRPHDDWPPSPEQIEAEWRRRRFPGRSLKARLDSSTRYGDHYIAACTYAVGLLHESGTGKPDPERATALSVAAVRELAIAARVAGSAHLAAKWDWILSEDPDLAGLRSRKEFRRFEAEFLLATRPAPLRPRQIVRLKASRYSAVLSRLCASRVEAVWRERARREGPVDIHEVMAWMYDERASLELARELVHHHRHWQTRLKVIFEMQRFLARNGGGSFKVSHPRYSDQPLEGTAVEVNRAAGQEIHFGDMRLNALAEVIRPPGSGPVPGLAEWVEYVEALDAAGVPLDPGVLRCLTENRVAAWGALRQVFSERVPLERRSAERFRERTEQRFRDIAGMLAQVPVPARTARFDRDYVSSPGPTA